MGRRPGAEKTRQLAVHRPGEHLEEEDRIGPDSTWPGGIYLPPPPPSPALQSSSAMELPALSGKVIAFSLTAFPVCYTLNHLSELSHPLGVAILSAMILVLLFVAISSLAQGEISHSPLFAVFTIFSFSSLIDLFIALQEDGYGMDFMEFYTREREPYLRTAHGIFSCYWDGIVHYLLYLIMTGAIAKRKRYRSLGLYWLGSLVMSIMVFVPGNILGKYSSELRLSFLFNVPYMLIPCWAGLHLFSQDRGPTGYTATMVCVSLA